MTIEVASGLEFGVGVDPGGEIGHVNRYVAVQIHLCLTTANHLFEQFTAQLRIGGKQGIGKVPGIVHPQTSCSTAPEFDCHKSTAASSAVVQPAPAYHDNVEGRKLGLNSIFVVETDGVRLAHLSDIGHTLSEATLEALRPLDILLVPVGGEFSIDGNQAKEIMARLQPRITVPIHYKTAVTADWPIADESAFLSSLENVKRLDSLTVTVTSETLPSRPEVWVMRYE